MAKITVDGTAYELDFQELSNKEAMLVEDTFGWPMKQWMELAENGSMRAITAAVWIIKRRENPDTAFESIEFTVASIESGKDEDGPKDEAVEPDASEETTSSTTSPTGATVHPLSSTA